MNENNRVVPIERLGRVARAAAARADLAEVRDADRVDASLVHDLRVVRGGLELVHEGERVVRGRAALDRDALLLSALRVLLRKQHLVAGLQRRT